MQLTSTLLASLLAATTAVAAPAKSMMAATPQWTIERMKRVCNENNTQCTWTFKIDTHEIKKTDCTLTVNATANVRASRAEGKPTTCGVFTVTSGWSGQFGEGQGFTVLSVVDKNKRLIIWPSYTDVQLKNGVVVEPDQSYGPQSV
ncbi:hypothetical protein GQ602_002544 [Ophiocordyceps camponoti-floridani]|uniref:Small secreted protein n=1 Tax=Ophiocordyceps camponoti-floridani TaxID=2030778 RepID=A0A8H4QAS1_9HYPO|nr:hypothetical protein GQ602_002544 [Ophiocordyceps camponoti-floridani]